MAGLFNSSRRMRAQAMGIESTWGTAVAAVRKFYGQTKILMDQPLVVTEEDRGWWAPTSNDRTFLGLKAATVTFQGAVVFQDMHWWGALALKGLSASSSGGTGTGATKTAYQWAFAPTLTSDDLKSATLEWSDNTQAWKANGCALNTLQITCDATQNRAPQISASFVAQQRSTVTYAAPADSTRYSALCAKSKVYVDPTTFGTTQMTGQVMSWNFGVNNNITGLVYCDGNDYIADYDRGQQVITAGCVLRHKNTTEITNWLAATERLIRFQMDGPLFVGAGTNWDAAQAYQVQIDVPGKWTAAVIGENRETVTVAYTLQNHYTTSGSLSNMVKMNVKTDGNDLTTA